MHKAFYLLLTTLIAFSTFLSATQMAYAQSPEPSSTLVVSAPGEVIGVLERGELLVMALKREKIDGNSIRLATQSISKIFDFRLSRAGDRYLYRLGKARKIEVLRYQRAQHIFEARLDENGDYQSSLVDTKSEQEKNRDNVVNPAPSLEDDDGEIDVESLALGKPIQQLAEPSENNNAALPSDNGFLDPNADEADFADPNSPRQAEDPALAGRISPDRVDDPSQANDALAPIIHNLDDVDDQGNRFGPMPEDKSLAEADIRPQFIEIGNSSANNGKAQSKLEHERSYAPLINAVYALGALLFLLSGLLVLRRNLNIGFRLRAGQLELKEKLVISDGQSLVMARYNNRHYLISMTRNKMALLDVIGNETLANTSWKQLKSQAYWPQMAEKPISDEALFAIIKDIDLKASQEISANDLDSETQDIDDQAMLETSYIVEDEDLLDDEV